MFVDTIYIFRVISCTFQAVGGKIGCIFWNLVCLQKKLVDYEPEI